ncbi:MAG: hypothetical protein C5S40_02740 [ANME-2 cluster archaeon]|nr:hypothetical protein [ANME-2 cluster archaeon]
MSAKIFIAIATLFLVHTVHAEEKGYGLFWSYKTGSNVWGVSVSSDDTYIAAASIDKNIYLS